MQEDKSGDRDLVNTAKEYLKEKYHKPGNVYVGLVHRLDRMVGGVCVLAKTSKAASRLSESIRIHEFKKVYRALVLDNGLAEKDTFEDYLLKDKAKNMVYVDSKGKYAKLDYHILEHRDNYCLVEINLHTGRSHQIRVQFASRGHALYGDQRYNKDAVVGQNIALWAYELSFKHPTTKEWLTFKAADIPF